MIKKIALVIVVLVILIQFIKPEKNISASPQPMAISARYRVPSHVANILKRACNDCHSNNTKYPWYNKIQPFAWFLDHHVKEGKAELNFDEFNTYSFKKRDHKLKEVVEVVQEGEMPIRSYTVMHRDAELTAEEQQQLINWANGLRSDLKKKIPASSGNAAR